MKTSDLGSLQVWSGCLYIQFGVRNVEFITLIKSNYKRKTMKENSFKRNRKAMMALLLCTGFIVTQPISVMAEKIMIFAQTAQQQKQSVSGLLKMLGGTCNWC